MKIIFILLLTSIWFLFALPSNGQDQKKLLEKTYKTKSVAKLKQFFEIWAKEIPPASDSEINLLNEREREAYKVFMAYYHPDSLSLMGFVNWRYNQYRQTNFLLLQNEIEIRTVDKICVTYNDSDSVIVQYINKFDTDSFQRLKDLERLSNGRLKAYVLENFGNFDYSQKSNFFIKIENFRPTINCRDKKPVYLTKSYFTLLNFFLGNSSVESTYLNYPSPKRSKRQSIRRFSFLNKLIHVDNRSDIGCYWLINTYPIIESITFDKSMSRAAITLRFELGGAESILIKEHNTWKVIASHATWVE